MPGASVNELETTNGAIGTPEELLTLEPASPEVKAYQRGKLWAGLGSLGLALAILAIFAFCVATRIDPWLIDVVGSSRWLRLAAWGFVVAVSLELVGLPLAFWSSFVLEKRYDLSTQTLAGW